MSGFLIDTNVLSEYTGPGVPIWASSDGSRRRIDRLST
jgi:hypothetical protein